jgi:hypothetical protein
MSQRVRARTGPAGDATRRAISVENSKMSVGLPLGHVAGRAAAGARASRAPQGGAVRLHAGGRGGRRGSREGSRSDCVALALAVLPLFLPPSAHRLRMRSQRAPSSPVATLPG